ncbi:MAG: hypothetical protein OCC45_06325 [Desulfotalea sp.]
MYFPDKTTNEKQPNQLDSVIVKRILERRYYYPFTENTLLFNPKLISHTDHDALGLSGWCG